jgi:hypothetical protein
MALKPLMAGRGYEGRGAGESRWVNKSPRQHLDA